MFVIVIYMCYNSCTCYLFVLLNLFLFLRFAMLFVPVIVRLAWLLFLFFGMCSLFFVRAMRCCSCMLFFVLAIVHVPVSDRCSLLVLFIS